MWAWFGSLPEKSPYRGGFIPVLVFLFFAGAFGRGLSAFFNLVFEPSGKHLYSFLTSKAFLSSAIVYFASTCVFYGIALQETQEDLRVCREMLARTLDEADEFRRIEREGDEPDE